MYCLANMCYVCLEKKNEPISNINSSLAVNKDIIHIIGYLPFDLAWLKTKRVILICEDCCLRLRQTYQFRSMCLKNSALLKSYTNNLNTSTAANTENEAELTIPLYLNNIHQDVNEVKSEIKLENDEVDRAECRPIIEETEDVHVKCEDGFVKEEYTSEREEADDYEERPMDNNTTDNKSNSEILVTTTENEAEVTVTSNVNKEPTNTNEEVKCELILKDEEMYTDECGPIIAETEDKPGNFEQCFVKEEVPWQRAEADVQEEHPMDNNCSAGTDNESDWAMSVKSNGPITDTDSVRSGFTCKQEQATNTEEFSATAKESYSCSTCSQSFTAKSDLSKHMRDIYQHIRLHTGEKPFKCSRCEKCFRLKRNLVRHMLIHTGEKPYKCSACGKCFRFHSNLTLHMRLHSGEKPYECSECGKCFAQKLYLATHMRIHTGEKPYKCASCEKCFSQNSSLVTHMRLHADVKPYKCSRCEKCFRYNSTLADHMRIHTGEKPFQCGICEKCFTLKASLVRHMRIHSDEKPYECSECGKCLTSPSDLRVHMLVHTGEKPFKCSRCEKHFSRRTNLKRHMRIHTGEKPFKCYICEKYFTDKSSLVYHMRTHTGT